jgi:hypothetical protein
MLEVAKAECLRLERENTSLRAALAAAVPPPTPGAKMWVNPEGVIHERPLPSCAGSYCTPYVAAVSS